MGERDDREVSMRGEKGEGDVRKRRRMQRHGTILGGKTGKRDGNERQMKREERSKVEVILVGDEEGKGERREGRGRGDKGRLGGPLEKDGEGMRDNTRERE